MNNTTEDLTVRQSRWASLITHLNDEWDASDDDDDDCMIAPGLSSKQKGIGMASSAGGVPAWGSGTGTKLITPFINPPPSSQWPGNEGLDAVEPTTCTHPLQNWIANYRDDGIGEGGKKKFLEKSVRILYSLVRKIVGEHNRKDANDDEVIIHPNFITTENVIVTENGVELSADFVERGDSIFFDDKRGEDETRKKYLAMNALGRIAYDMCMPEDGPSVPTFCSRKASADTRCDSIQNLRTQIVSLPSNALSTQGKEDVTFDEEDVIMNLLKNPCTTTSEDKDSSGLASTMLDANIPFPLVRFISDLLDNEHNRMFRTDHSFSTLKDVVSDLKQMVDNPNDFLHASSPDRWKLVFGDKLYGRDGDTMAFMDAADRVANVQDDPLFGGLLRLTGKKREVIMVSGHSGAGKSQLVKSGGALLEKRGWWSLRCKFDRVVHPEPLSILAYAFDQFFGSFASSSCSEGLQEICQRIKRIISLEGLGILDKHIPALSLVLDVTLPTGTVEVNETTMASLFRKLLQAISSGRTPILFFIDDLQWADPLSLSLLMALVQGTSHELLNLSSTNGNSRSDCNGIDPEEDEIQIMFAGSYRDNEVIEDHPLANVLSKFESDSSINVTSISLSRFTFETLNGMLSDSLCLPVRRVRSLSELVIQKTDGQPLHIIVFIQALSMKNLLTHSFTRGWEWDADSIDICAITDSVAELYAFNLKRLPEDILLGLQIISCFGSQIDQNVLRFVADYDDEISADISATIETAVSEGIIGRAAQLISFTHDMIQKACIDSIQESDLVPLLRKLAAALIRNASAVGELDSVLFVVVDLINRIGSDDTSFPAEQALFAQLNSQAGLKAIAVADFAGAAKYAESGIAFLSDNCWEEQYDLSLSLYEIAVVSHFSSLTGDRNLLTKRINAVFEHAKDFLDQFKTHRIWVAVLSMTDPAKAIEESLTALERLEEPLDLADIDYNRVRNELMKIRDQFSGDRAKRFVSTNRLSDCSKIRSMKIMRSIIWYFQQIKPFMVGFIACRMVEMSINYGHCEDTVIAVAAAASCINSVLGDIDEASAWGRMALSLMKLYDDDILIPFTHAILYGTVFSFTEPIQSTLEPLAQGIRLSFATGNVECAFFNIIYYIRRSFNSGKSLSVLTEEVETLARQQGNNYCFEPSAGKTIYGPLLQFFLTPMYNVLRELQGGEDLYEEEEPSFPLDKVKFVNNDEIMEAALEKDLASFHGTISIQIPQAFICRDMESALRLTDLYCEHFLLAEGPQLFKSISNEFFEALTSFYFMRQTGEERYMIRGENALRKIREWSVHSDWNFKNKLLLVEAEMHNTRKEFDKAAVCYEASIRASQKHKFIHEEAIAIELAGIFFFERGLRQISKSFFEHSIECYEKWGAFAVANRVRGKIRDEFGTDCIQP